MNLFELFVKIGVDDQASGKLSKISSSLGKGLATSAKIGTTAVAAATTGIAALTKQSVQSYAEFEQLVGGAKLMFGDAFDSVMQNAQDAFKTVQMSQNEYLKQVNGFATGLKTALGDNEQAAAALAHRIVQAEADIVAATGNTAENVQNAFNGIMKSNFTMLDNLQIGITPTKEGFQEVIDKVNEWNKANREATNYQMGNLADMQSALVDYIEMQGYAGYAADEASKTISGSVASMRSAWKNLLVGMADDNADFGSLVDDLVLTLAGDENGQGGVIGNMLPRIENAIGGISSLIEKAAPIIVSSVPSLISEIVPSLISGATGLVESVIEVLPELLEMVSEALIENAPALIETAFVLVDSLISGLGSNYEMILNAAFQLVGQLGSGILSRLPELVSLGLEMALSLINGVSSSLPSVLQAAVSLITEMANTLTAPEQLESILDSAIALIEGLSNGLMDSIPQLVAAAVLIIENLVTFFLTPENLAKILKMAFDLVVGIGTGLISAIPELLKSVGEIIAGIVSSFRDTDWGKIGSDLVAGFKAGISKAWGNLKKWFTGLFGDLTEIAKKILGIASPSKVFKKIGGFTAEGFGIGFEDEFAQVKDDMEDALNFDDASVGINASIRKVGAGAAGGAFGGTTIGSIAINIDGANYEDEETLAMVIAEKIQNMTDRRAAVYA